MQFLLLEVPDIFVLLVAERTQLTLAQVFVAALLPIETIEYHKRKRRQTTFFCCVDGAFLLAAAGAAALAFGCVLID